MAAGPVTGAVSPLFYRNMKQMMSFLSLKRAGLAFGVAMAAAIVSQVKADELQLIWSLAPGDRAYITTDNTQRGLAYNKKTQHLLVVNRAGGLTVQILDASTGADVGVLDTSGIAGGTFVLSMIGVADDGVIYAANLSTSTTAPNLKVYRWEDESAAPTVAFEGDPAGGGNNQRWGDSFDIRGAGNATQILFGSNAGTVAALLTTTDGATFTAKIISNASAAGALGVAFGTGNTFWTKKNAQSLRLVQFDLATGVGTTMQNYGTTAIPSGMAPIAVNAAKNLLAGVVIETPDNLRVYDLSNLTSGPALVDQENFPTDNANANLVGSADMSDDLVFALETNNGIVAYRLIATVVAPAIITPPGNRTVLEGGSTLFTVSAVGTAPLRYQWALDTTNILNATNASLSLSNISAADGGSYTVRISNSAGAVTSVGAVLTVAPAVRSDALSVVWSLPAGSRPYLTDGNTERGLAYNPITTNLVLVTRTENVAAYVLDANTGAQRWKLNLDPTIVTGSNPSGFRLNMVRVADDGAVYGANLTTGGGGFAVYRWADDSSNSVPAVAYLGDPGQSQRWGDSMDVRGAGANTQILLGSRNGTIAAILTTANGLDFDATVIETDAAAGNFGLGVAFGDGNTFWGKSLGTGTPLRLMQFDLTTGQGTTLQSFPAVASSIGPIGVEPKQGWLAGIAVENPDNVRFYNITNLAADPVLVDQEFFPTDGDNLNGTGSVDFGGGRVYALDSNNGILAMAIKTSSGTVGAPATLGSARFQGNGQFELTLTGTPGATYEVQTSTDLKAWATLSNVTPGAGGSVLVSDAAPAAGFRFYRAITK